MRPVDHVADPVPTGLDEQIPERVAGRTRAGDSRPRLQDAHRSPIHPPPSSRPARPNIDRPLQHWRERVVLDTVKLAVRHKLMCVLVAILSTAAGAAATLVQPPFYVATASLYPPQAGGPLSGLGIASMAGLMGGLGIGGDPSSKFPLYEHFLFSRRLGSALLETPLDIAGRQVSFLEYLQIEEPDPSLKKEAALMLVREKLSFEVDKKTAVVKIGYMDADPEVAATIVNAAVELLNDFDVSTTSGKAEERRRFVEVQMAESAAALSRAEERLETFRTQNLRIGKAPDLMLEQARLLREVEIEQEIYLTLRKEYEIARIDEQRSLPVVNVLDRAEPPVLPAGPSLVRNAVLACALGLGFVLAILTLRAVQPRRLVAEFLAR